VQQKYLDFLHRSTHILPQRRNTVPHGNGTILREELTMATTQDFTAMMKDMMGAFPVDTKSFEESFKTSATLNEKLSGVALEAAEKSTDLSTKWTKDTLSKMAALTKVKAEPADYAKAMTDFATATAEMAAENGRADDGSRQGHGRRNLCRRAESGKRNHRSRQESCREVRFSTRSLSSLIERGIKAGPPGPAFFRVRVPDVARGSRARPPVPPLRCCPGRSAARVAPKRPRRAGQEGAA
jgi:hypothetical protein